MFNEAPEDSNYTLLPEDRPGGFNWGGENAQNVNAAAEEEEEWMLFVAECKNWGEKEIKE